SGRRATRRRPDGGRETDSRASGTARTPKSWKFVKFDREFRFPRGEHRRRKKISKIAAEARYLYCVTAVRASSIRALEAERFALTCRVNAERFAVMRRAWGGVRRGS